MQIARGLTLFAMLSMTLAAGQCQMTTPEATETEKELCRAWGSSLPSRSHQDTQQTRDEIGQAYRDFEAACPGFKVDVHPGKTLIG